jgi:hypothetical protein
MNTRVNQCSRDFFNGIQKTTDARHTVRSLWTEVVSGHLVSVHHLTEMLTDGYFTHKFERYEHILGDGQGQTCARVSRDVD